MTSQKEKTILTIIDSLDSLCQRTTSGNYMHNIANIRASLQYIRDTIQDTE